jgi:soluble lytic murein transglycosylase-like protein
MLKRLLAQGAVVGVGALALMGLGTVSSILAGHTPTGTELGIEADAPVDSTTMAGQLVATRAELERAHRILEFSGRYRIPADLSARIYDTALAEGIPPALGFQLVKIESQFKNTAQSHMAAIGLTQLRILTARAYDPTIDESDLMNPDVNLRIGFRYLKDLLKRFDNDLALALEAYNKGPTLITAQMAQGEEVRGRYSRKVLSGI